MGRIGLGIMCTNNVQPKLLLLTLLVRTKKVMLFSQHIFSYLYIYVSKGKKVVSDEWTDKVSSRDRFSHNDKLEEVFKRLYMPTTQPNST